MATSLPAGLRPPTSSRASVAWLRPVPDGPPPAEGPAPRTRALASTVDGTALATAVVGTILDEVFPDRRDDLAFRDALGSCVGENVAAILDLLRGQTTLGAMEPHRALRFADLAAELHIPVSVLERTYWVGVARLWQAWLDVVVADRPEPDALQGLLGGPTAVVFAYVDRVLSAVIPRYHRRRDELARRSDHLRRETLETIVDGHGEADPDALESWERTLGYRLRGAHLALVVDLDADRSLPALVGELRTASRATASVCRQEGARSWTIWLGHPEGFEEDRLAALRRRLEQLVVRVAVGEPGTRLTGFRRSREQALQAARVQRAVGGLEDGTPISWYADVRLESLLLADEAAARRYVAEELGPLAADDERCERIRDTLLAWLGSGSQAAAAATLGLHENTVRHRIRQAEALLPDVLAQRRTELQVALRLARVLGA